MGGPAERRDVDGGVRRGSRPGEGRARPGSDRAARTRSRPCAGSGAGAAQRSRPVGRVLKGQCMSLPLGVKVATDALRTEAGVWDQQSGQMDAIATKVDGLRFNRLEAGVFQLVVGPYGELV